MSNISKFLRRASCATCGWHQVWGPEEMLQWLRAQGKLRRLAKPDQELIWQLFQPLIHLLTCPDCGSAGLHLGPIDDADDWGQAPACEACRQPIPSERLEVFPDAKRCAACQDKPDTEPMEADFCPRCGGTMQLRSSGGAGLTRYLSVCSACGLRQG